MIKWKEIRQEEKEYKNNSREEKVKNKQKERSVKSLCLLLTLAMFKISLTRAKAKQIWQPEKKYIMNSLEGKELN